MNRILAPLFFGLLIAFGFANGAFASELHAIVVCDTHAINLEEGVEQDLKHIKKELKKIAKLTGLELSMHLFKGHQVNSGFMDTVKNLKAGPDDVIVFYWSGHGTHFYDQKDPWPYFDFEYDRDLQSLYQVALELMKKEARLVLAIADCCNDYQGRPVARTLLDRPVSYKEQEGYRKLFMQAEGTYIATAALPGEASIALDEKDHEIGVPGGSFFTNALLETLHSETEKFSPELSWELIFTIASQKAIEYQLNDPEDSVIYHHPQFQRLSR